MKCFTVQQLNDLSISENIDSVLHKKGNPIRKRQINNDIELFIYKDFKFWIRSDKILQISIFKSSAISYRNLKIGIKPPKNDDNFGELMYDKNDEVWSYLHLKGLCFTIENNVINEIFVS